MGFAFSLNVKMDEKMMSAAPGNSLTSEGPPCAPPIPELCQLLWLQPPAHLEEVQQASPTAGGGRQQVYRGPYLWEPFALTGDMCKDAALLGGGEAQLQTAERRAPPGWAPLGTVPRGTGRRGKDPQSPWGLQFLSGGGCAEFSEGLSWACGSGGSAR